jgi:hypothetical protein
MLEPHHYTTSEKAKHFSKWYVSSGQVAHTYNLRIQMLRQEDLKFEAVLIYTTRHCLKTTTKSSV